MKIYKDYVNEATKQAKYLANLGDFDLYLNEENEVIQVLHENISGWQTQEPKHTWLKDDEIRSLHILIDRYHDAATTDEQDDCKFAILDVI